MDVLDLAAGTGKLTRLLVGTGARVVAAEPSPGMLVELRRTVPAVAAVAALAERLPFADAAFDVVACGQAFHWFDGPTALAQLHRTLRPGGRLVLLWNVRDRSMAWVERLAELTEPYRSGVPTYRDGAWRKAFDSTTLFTPLERRQCPYEHDVDAATMVERVSSISWIACLPDPERVELLDQVRHLFDGMPPRFPVPYHTDIWWAHRT